MNIVFVMLLLAPLMQVEQVVPASVYSACSDANARIAAAVAFAAEYEPAWAADAREQLSDDPQYAERVVNAIHDAAEISGLDPAVLWSIAHTETRGRHQDDHNHVKRGSAGEIGLMQIKPFWQRALQREYGVEVDLYNLEDNILASTYILKRGGSDVDVMLSYYNTGQRIRNTAYQRKVIRYLASLDQGLNN
ncbi:transglycosylase SLT domain-containing protein [bacterium]|nr:transglycosylase SLT domain-containing protein [bacterium]